MTDEWKDWYSPAEIRYTLPQMWFLIAHLPELSCGEYPRGTEVQIKGMNSHIAPFETACRFSAEVKSRLEPTGKAGKSLILQIDAGNTFDALTEDARSALFYVSGWRRKMMPFYAWKKQILYRRRVKR